MTAWTRSRRPSLAGRWPTWFLTVASLTTSSLAISVLLLPRATSRRMSRSRGVSDASREGRGTAVSGRGGDALWEAVPPRGGQRRQPGRPRHGCLGAARERLDQPPRHRRREQRVPGGG